MNEQILKINPVIQLRNINIIKRANEFSTLLSTNLQLVHANYNGLFDCKNHTNLHLVHANYNWSMLIIMTYLIAKTIHLMHLMHLIFLIHLPDNRTISFIFQQTLRIHLHYFLQLNMARLYIFRFNLEVSHLLFVQHYIRYS